MFADVVTAIQKFNASCAVAGYQALRKPKWQRKSIASGAGQGSCEPCQKKAQALQSWQKAVREARQDLGLTKDVVPRNGTELYKRAKVLMLKHQSENQVEQPAGIWQSGIDISLMHLEAEFMLDKTD